MSKKLIYISIFILFVVLIPICTAGKVKYSIKLIPVSNSMAPRYTFNDIIEIQTPVNYTLGNTYCCRNNGRFQLPWYIYICHELVGIDGQILQFKGINNTFYDAPIEKKYCAWEIVGKANHNYN